MYTSTRLHTRLPSNVGLRGDVIGAHIWCTFCVI